MSLSTEKNRAFKGTAFACTALVIGVVAACSSSTSSGTVPPVDSGASTTTATCASPGAPTAGAADSHCQGQPVQSTSEASCHVTDGGPAPDGGGDTDTCDYGATMFGMEGDDDDCKYHVTWTSTSLCEGAAGVQFTAHVSNLGDGSPVTGIPQGVLPEVFIPQDPNAACDDQSTHPSPSVNPIMVETPAGSGTYVGKVIFDAPGQWTIRFHIHEECADVLDDSPHGHAAFRLTLP